MSVATVPLLGIQTPRLEWIPDSVGNGAEEVVELAALAGLHLDPWQKYVLRGALGTDNKGLWQAFEVAVIVARQNGKGSILEALELAWLFLFPDDKLILHSAHEFKTASEAFLRVRGLIEGCDELRRLVKKISAAHGEEGVELLDGTRLRFVARTKGSGRGFSADKVILDEAYNLPDSMIDAIVPTTGARVNPQVWYTSSAPDQSIAPCDALARVRSRGLKGGDSRLAYFEWSAPFDEKTLQVLGDPSDPKLWAVAQPSLGYRKPLDRIEAFHSSMSPDGFAREELGVGNYPLVDEEGMIVPTWDDLGTGGAQEQIVGRPVFAVEVAADKSRASVAVAGRRADRRTQVELAGSSSGTVWVPEWVAQRTSKWNAVVVVDPRSPAEPLIAQLRTLGVDVHEVTGAEWTAALGRFTSKCEADKVRHLNDPVLRDSMRGTVTKHSSQAALVIDRNRTRGDVTPFTAAVLAAAHHWTIEDADYNPLDSIG